MTIALPKAPAVDRETLRGAIREEYEEVAREPGKGFHFHTGRRLAAILGYDEALFEGVPEDEIRQITLTNSAETFGFKVPELSTP